MKQKIIFGLTFSLGFFMSMAQTENTRIKNGLIIYLNNDSSHFLKATFLNQTWMRYNENNPGSTVFGTVENTTFDIGLRRTRMQFFGLITDRVFVYSQFGQNNFNYLSPRKAGTFFHDVTAEYGLSKKHLWLGAGLTGWSGLSRYASPSVGSILTMDAPLFQQATNDATDQFLRKLSIYAKGKLGKLDYRVALSKPMSIENSSLNYAKLNAYSDFSKAPPHLQYQGYFMFQFLDKELNLTPYTIGTYLGKKRVFNIGAGFIFQNNAMIRKVASDSISSNMELFAVDVFYDAPLNKQKGTAITAYCGYFNTNFGKGHIRNLGPMAPTNGVDKTLASFNGSGSAFPMYGTGAVLYAQTGFLLPDRLLGKLGKLQPYASWMHAKYDRLSDAVQTFDLGCNWLIHGQGSKLSFNYQSRPIFNTGGLGSQAFKTGRRGCFVLQYQISI